MPAQEVAIAAYDDETHVEENRALYRAKFDLADQIIGNRYGYKRPAGGFFLWLDVSAQGGSEAATLKLWKEAGLRVVPGQLRGARPGRRLQSRRRLHPRRDGAGPRDRPPRRCIALWRCWAEGADAWQPSATRSPTADILSGRVARGAAPPPARDHRRLRCSAFAGIAAVALATWSVQDPSLSHATNAPVRNMLGLPGAIGADLMMQLLGIATIAFLFPVAAWGWRLLTHRPLDRERARLALWIVGAARGRGFASCLPAARPGRCRPGSAA